MSGANEIAFPDDFEVIDGNVAAKQHRDYQVHDEYVYCRRCAVRRPAIKLAMAYGIPVCKDHKIDGLTFDEAVEAKNGNAKMPEVRQLQVEMHLPPGQSFVNATDAPMCLGCGSITVRSGSCHKCLNCGSTTGCS